MTSEGRINGKVVEASRVAGTNRLGSLGVFVYGEGAPQAMAIHRHHLHPIPIIALTHINPTSSYARKDRDLENLIASSRARRNGTVLLVLVQRKHLQGIVRLGRVARL